MSNYLKKYNIQFLALTLIFLITRYNGLNFVIEKEFFFEQNYINAIQNNFYEYSSFNHTILYGNLLLNKLLLTEVNIVEYDEGIILRF